MDLNIITDEIAGDVADGTAIINRATFAGRLRLDIVTDEVAGDVADGGVFIINRATVAVRRLRLDIVTDEIAGDVADGGS